MVRDEARDAVARFELRDDGRGGGVAEAGLGEGVAQEGEGGPEDGVENGCESRDAHAARPTRMAAVLCVCLRGNVLLHTRLRRCKSQPDGEDEADVEEEVVVVDKGQGEADEKEEQEGKDEQDIL